MGKIKHYGYGLLWILVVSCQTKKDRIARVLTIREMGDLATTAYTITKIVKANDNQTWYKIGDRKILMSVEATIKAGIDLKAVKAEDVQIDGTSIRLRLPEPRLISLSIPPDKIKVAYQEVGVLRMEYDNAERDALLAQGEQQIRKAVDETGIYKTTKAHTTQFLTVLLQELGYEKISIQFGTANNYQP